MRAPHARRVECATLEVVADPTGRADDDIDAVADIVALRPKRRAAIPVAQTKAAGRRFSRFSSWCGETARWDGPLRAGCVGGETGGAGVCVCVCVCVCGWGWGVQA